MGVEISVIGASPLFDSDSESVGGGDFSEVMLCRPLSLHPPFTQIQ